MREREKAGLTCGPWGPNLWPQPVAPTCGAYPHSRWERTFFYIHSVHPTGYLRKPLRYWDLAQRQCSRALTATLHGTAHFLSPTEKQQQIRAGSAASDGPETRAAYIKVIALEKFQKSKGKNAKRHSGSNKVDYGKRHILFKPQNNLGQTHEAQRESQKSFLCY